MGKVPYQKALLFGPLLGPKIIGPILLDLLLFVLRPDPILFGFILGPPMRLTIGPKNKCRKFFLEKISRIFFRKISETSFFGITPELFSRLIF
jgi:hypothetical protein